MKFNVTAAIATLLVTNLCYANYEVVNGTVGNDYIRVPLEYRYATAYAGKGHDTIRSEAHDATLWGQDGDDEIRANGHNSVLQGGNGNDWLISRGTNAILRGGDGNDDMSSYGAINKFVGGLGADQIFARGSNTIYYTLGDGNDYLTFYVKGGEVNTIRCTDTAPEKTRIELIYNMTLVLRFVNGQTIKVAIHDAASTQAYEFASVSDFKKFVNLSSCANL